MNFDPEGALLQVGADYGAMTGLFRQSVAEVTVLDEDANALETVKLRYPMARNIRLKQSTLAGYAAGLPQEDLYDYVVFAGTLRAPYEENIRAAKSLLKPDGVLIVAAANSLAMKYWAGTAREENALSKKKLLELLSGENTHFYYPMPDYRTPVSIYSDSYLPKKGDLTRVVPAYDYPRYHMMDMGEGFDEVCEAGVFDLYANSYLVFWSADRKRLHPKEDQIFIKYNKTRRETFQIKTAICTDRRMPG